MDKIRNIRQALKVMKETFPNAHVSVATRTDRYTSGDERSEKRMYTNAVSGPTSYGISGEGETWDIAFERLMAQVDEAKDD